ncbi:MAG: hypothetical protein HC777_01780, partial [Hyphomonadaceae bacterium]|nr:hypothetical protein [Hyphomonadaceae bacterium]
MDATQGSDRLTGGLGIDQFLVSTDGGTT